LGFVCFEDLERGEYNATVAIPDGYNATTSLSFIATLNSGEETLLAFGAQPNTETLAQAPSPAGSGNNPLLGILGGFLLILGVIFGIYTLIYGRK
jgi:hypothetical protein